MVFSVLRAKFSYHWLQWDSNQFWVNVLWVWLGDSSIFCGKSFGNVNLPCLMVCSAGCRWMQDQFLTDKHWDLYQEDTICIWVGISHFRPVSGLTDYSVNIWPLFTCWKLKCYSICWSSPCLLLQVIFLMENTKIAKKENAKTYFCILITGFPGCQSILFCNYAQHFYFYGFTESCWKGRNAVLNTSIISNNALEWKKIIREIPESNFLCHYIYVITIHWWHSTVIINTAVRA